MASAVPELVLDREWTSPPQLVRALWGARELCTILARKEFFVRYRRATFGVLWAVALPAIQAVVLAVVLARVAKISVPHYPIFIFSGTVGWTYFSTGLAAASSAIVDNSALSSRIYFPRAVLPIASCLANVFALVISVVIMLVVAAAFGLLPSVRTLYVFPGAVLVLVITVAMTLVLSGLHVYFRDIRYAVQAALLVWFYLTPVFFPLSLLRHSWVRAVVIVNPLTGPIQLFHAAVVPGYRIAPVALISTGAWTIALLGAALVLHCRRDRLFADLL
jgi:lipopolysaccharide transport system permease protein